MSRVRDEMSIVGSRKEGIGPTEKPIGDQAKPFMYRNTQRIAMPNGVEHRRREHLETSFPEGAGRARHVRRGGHKDPSLTGMGME